jgi:hypothetical protein
MQLRNKVKVGLVGVVVTGGGVAAALLGPTGPAVGQSSPPIQAQIQVTAPGTLAAKGAAVDVVVTMECSGPPGTTGSFSVGFTERAASGLATGAGGGTVACTGTSQTTLVVATAEPGSKPFKRGTALMNAGISACTPDFSSCASQQVGPTTFPIQ